MESDAPLEPWQPRLRVLCLHGRCQTAEILRQQLDRLSTKSASFAEFVFVEGPAELPLQHGEKVNTRGWAEEGAGVNVAPVRDVLDLAWQSQGPFDGVLGFSEGCSAALLYCHLNAAAEVDGAAAVDRAFLGLHFVILAGGPAPPPDVAIDRPFRVSSLHIASAGDAIVPIAQSRALAACFEDARFYQHGGGHSIPQRVEDVKQMIDFLVKVRDKAYPRFAAMSTLPAEDGDEEDPRVNAEQRDELELLAASFSPEEMIRVTPKWPVRLGMQITGLAGASLRFMLPPAYPQTAPCICIFETNGQSHLLAHEQELMEAVECAREPPGSFSVLGMAQAAVQWVQEHEAGIAARAAMGPGASAPRADAASDPSDEEPEDGAGAWYRREEVCLDEALFAEAERRAAEMLPDDQAHSQAWARISGAASYGKPWEFVVGLVGKPSVGKSTLFNAATRPDASRQAAMDPRPFTTIDPNVGPGWFAAPCPGELLGRGAEAQPEHGKAVGGRRKHPLLIKDVAGLVPGAYEGRGRGNQFLDALNGADSLVHVVDASGRSDASGVDLGAAEATGDPLDEVGWVRREIHLWIFCNVRTKWESVRKKARIPSKHQAKEAVLSRLFALFTGYKATATFTQKVFEAAGFSTQGIEDKILEWQEYDLHLFVACFLRARFPIVVALNKTDMPGAAGHVSRAQAALGGACMPVSARGEWWLYEQQRLGHLTYVEGAGAESVVLGPSAPPAAVAQWEELRTRVFEAYGSTGVMEVISAAVLRRRPIFVCPVTDFGACEGLIRASAAPKGGGRGEPFGTMVMLRPMSSVDEATSAILHEEMLRGDFVRAEVLESPVGTRVLKREDELKVVGGDAGAPQAFVLKILTNRKAPWQK